MSTAPSVTRPRSALVWLPLACAWIAVAGNLPLWRQMHALGLLAQPAGWGLAAALAGIIACALLVLLSLLAWRRTLGPVLVATLIATAVLTHFQWSYGVLMDPGMATNVLQTDPHEAAALLDWRLLVTLVMLAAWPAWLLWRRPLAMPGWRRQAAHNLATAVTGLLGAVLLTGLAFQPLASTMRNHKALRYLITPLNAVYAFGQAAAEPWRARHAGLAPLGTDARAAEGGERPPLLLLVLGETARAGNFGLNGYPRDTTPRLRRLGVASWRNAWSCGTSTAASVPCMFSHLGQQGFAAREQDHENLLDVLQHAGLAVLWVDNQSGCKGVCARVPSATTEGPDEVLLQDLDARIAALPAERRARGVVVVLHQMGSHGPAYAQRSPAALKAFQPECASVQLQDCEPEALINAYDNSIRYTDHVLAQAIGWLRRHERRNDGALLYVSDHGESLGEHNLYLHGLPWAIAPDVQKRVPWITWLSEGFQRRSGITMACLRSRTDQAIRHDHYFHAVLGLMKVSTRVYQPALDPYLPCTAY